MLKRIGLPVTLLLWLAVPGHTDTADAPRTLSNITYDTDYDVFYQQQFHALFPRVHEAVPLAYARLIKRWGINDAGGLQHPLTVYIKEVPSKTLRRWETAFVEAKGRGSQLKQSLVVEIGAYDEHPDEDLTLVITHEMAHVLLMDTVSGGRGGDIPPWFNEGLAQSTTREGHDRVLGDVEELRRTGAPLLPCDLDGPLDEFAHGPFNGGCYPDFYLAVKRLEQLGGPQSIPRAINGLRDGTRLPELVQALTGKEWPDFKRDVAQYTQDVLSGSKRVP